MTDNPNIIDGVFTLKALLGEGGMAKVYSAEVDLSNLALSLARQEAMWNFITEGHRENQKHRGTQRKTSVSFVANFLGGDQSAGLALEFLTQRHEEHKEKVEIVSKGAFVLFVSLW